MKRKLLTLLHEFRLLALLLFIGFGSFAQTIGIPSVNSSGGPVLITFNVTNGVGTSAHFNGATNYTVYLSNSSGVNFTPIQTFNSSTFPTPVNLASASITRSVAIPVGTAPGTGYRIAISSGLPSSVGAVGLNASAPFTLSHQFTMPALQNGYIKCSSPATTFYLVTITNTGTLTDSYNLSFNQTQTYLGCFIWTLNSAPLSSTPAIEPGESYTFMVRLETPNGTQPDQWNTTVITGISQNTPSIVHTTTLSTYIYCGGNSPNLPNAPDMEIIKTASVASAQVGDMIDYTITIKNNNTKNAQNPVIKDYLPSNADLISYNKAPGENRNVSFSYNAAQNTLSAFVQSTMTNASVPLTIHVRIRTSCASVPMVTNSAEIFNSSGDTNSSNDLSTVSTAVSYDLTSSDLGRWTGTVSTDWFDCRNWSGGVVPTNTIDAIIPNLPNKPVISSLSPRAPADKIARTHHITVNSNSSLSMTNAGLLHVAGNLNNDGSFSAGNGSVTFMGSTAGIYQNIAAATQQINFYNLIVNSSNGAKGVLVPDEFGLFVANDLNLTSGDLRLFGKSQLIQTKGGASSNFNLGTGKLLVDQQGVSSKYSYNYWSSPVNLGGTFTVASVMKDGSNTSNPLDINWTTSYDGSPTSPITLSTYWINKYQNQSSSYANWSWVGPTGTLALGQGFTLKGCGAATPLQNYTFVGKPNSGAFSSIVSSNNMNLCGNPYPSAFDAYQFIDDNLATITGTLFFWEQFSTNASHVTANYEGGYATLTKTGAVPPVSPAGISSAGGSSRTPGRYIPIGQGFLIFGSAAGGAISFNNGQRAFVKETDDLSNPLFRSTTSETTTKKRVRIGFATETCTRQLLLGFMDQDATEAYDKGYDAVQLDTRATDAYFKVEEKKLVIQGKGTFKKGSSAMLGVQMAQAGPARFEVDATDNMEGQSVFLFDSATNISYNLSESPVTLTLDAGIYDNRFSIRFDSSGSRGELSARSIFILSDRNEIKIQNNDEQMLNQVSIYNMIGREVLNWSLDSTASEISLPVSGLAAGMYVLKINSGAEVVSEKIQIRN